MHIVRSTGILLLLSFMGPLTAIAADAPAGQLFIVHFSTGPAWDTARPAGEQPGFGEHSANLNRLRADGVILFGARYEDYGVLVMRAESADALAALLGEDPGVRSGIFSFRVAPLNVFYPWQDGAGMNR